MGTNAMPLGEGSGSLFQAAAALRGKLIATLISEGRHEQARRLSNPGSEGYAEEEDFPTLARIASLSFEIVIESAPHMQPRKYGDGDPRARFIAAATGMLQSCMTGRSAAASRGRRRQYASHIRSRRLLISSSRRSSMASRLLRNAASSLLTDHNQLYEFVIVCRIC